MHPYDEDYDDYYYSPDEYSDDVGYYDEQHYYEEEEDAEYYANEETERQQREDEGFAMLTGGFGYDNTKHNSGCMLLLLPLFCAVTALLFLSLL